MDWVLDGFLGLLGALPLALLVWLDGHYLKAVQDHFAEFYAQHHAELPAPTQFAIDASLALSTAAVGTLFLILALMLRALVSVVGGRVALVAQALFSWAAVLLVLWVMALPAQSLIASRTRIPGVVPCVNWAIGFMRHPPPPITK